MYESCSSLLEFKIANMKNITAHLSLFGANFIWACSYPLYKLTMPHYIEPLALLTLVLLVSAALSLTTLAKEWCRGCHTPIDRGDIWALLGAGMLIAVLRKGFLIYGLSLTSPIDGSIISTLSPIVVLIISLFVGIERFSFRKSIGVLLGFTGALGVILSSVTKSDIGAGVKGNIMVLIRHYFP